MKYEYCYLYAIVIIDFLRIILCGIMYNNDFPLMNIKPGKADSKLAGKDTLFIIFWII